MFLLPAAGPPPEPRQYVSPPAYVCPKDTWPVFHHDPVVTDQIPEGGERAPAARPATPRCSETLDVAGAVAVAEWESRGAITDDRAVVAAAYAVTMTPPAHAKANCLQDKARSLTVDLGLFRLSSKNSTPYEPSSFGVSVHRAGHFYQDSQDLRARRGGVFLYPGATVLARLQPTGDPTQAFYFYHFRLPATVCKGSPPYAVIGRPAFKAAVPFDPWLDEPVGPWTFFILPMYRTARVAPGGPGQYRSLTLLPGEVPGSTPSSLTPGAVAQLFPKASASLSSMVETYFGWRASNRLPLRCSTDVVCAEAHEYFGLQGDVDGSVVVGFTPDHSSLLAHVNHYKLGVTKHMYKKAREAEHRLRGSTLEASRQKEAQLTPTGTRKGKKGEGGAGKKRKATAAAVQQGDRGGTTCTKRRRRSRSISTANVLSSSDDEDAHTTRTDSDVEEADKVVGKSWVTKRTHDRVKGDVTRLKAKVATLQVIRDNTAKSYRPYRTQLTHTVTGHRRSRCQTRNCLTSRRKHTSGR